MGGSNTASGTSGAKMLTRVESRSTCLQRRSSATSQVALQVNAMASLSESLNSWSRRRETRSTLQKKRSAEVGSILFYRGKVAVDSQGLGVVGDCPISRLDHMAFIPQRVSKVRGRKSGKEVVVLGKDKVSGIQWPGHNGFKLPFWKWTFRRRETLGDATSATEIKEPYFSVPERSCCKDVIL